MPKYKELVPCELCDEALSWRHVLTVNGYVVCASCRPKAERLEAKPAKTEPPPAMAATESAPMSGEPLLFLYRNHKGEVAERRVLPRLLRFGISEDHPEGRYLLEADDLDRQAPRTFALDNILRLGTPPDPDHLLPIDPVWLHEVASAGFTGLETGTTRLGEFAVLWNDRNSWVFTGPAAHAAAYLLNSLSPRVAQALAVLIQNTGVGHG